MLVLGVHGGEKFENEDDPIGYAFHDSAAVLLRDGEIIAGIEEERLNRIKHSNCFPVRAIQSVLDSGNYSLSDVEVIATNRSEFYFDFLSKMSVVDDPTDTLPRDGRARFANLFQKAFRQDVSQKLYFCHHHYAHAWSAFLCSGLDSSLVLSVDGDGDGDSGIIMQGQGQELRKIQEFKRPQSLGQFYENLIRIVGYGRFDEYKVMGLAPYGRPDRFRKLFEQCYELLPHGSYRLESRMGWFSAFEAAGLTQHARRKGAPFLQIHKDFAATLQETIETIVLHVLRYYRDETGEKNLCLAGGVAHNCTLNGKIVYSGLFEKVFVQPAAHDAGGALGAAMAAWYQQTPPRPPVKMKHVYWGTPIGDSDEIEAALKRWSGFIYYERDPAITKTAAKLLAEGAVLGWARGRSEFGPRALGNRSILADPRPSENKDRINEMVKKRESYRPLAPSILEERVADFFEEFPGQEDLPFMTVALRVRESARTWLGAVTHVDGTARLQTVSSATNPDYWALIREFEQLTGVPILLNTSFNNDAEPIVDSVDDATGCFVTTGLNYLVVGEYLVRKKPLEEMRRAVLTIAPELASFRKLVQRAKPKHQWNGHQAQFAIENIKSSYFGPSTHAVSPEMFQVLQRADGRQVFECLLDQAGVGKECSGRLITEMMELWSRRLVRVSPPQ